MQCFILITFLLIWKRLNDEHPYYFESLNIIRSGTLVMIIFPCVISLISNLFNIDSVVIPILNMVLCVVGFIIGVLLCKQLYRRKITNIFKNLKEKNLLYVKLENEYAKASSGSSNSEEEEEETNSSSESENEENEQEMISRSENSSSISEGDESQEGETMLSKKKAYFSEETLNRINIKKNIFDSIEEIGIIFFIMFNISSLLNIFFSIMN